MTVVSNFFSLTRRKIYPRQKHHLWQKGNQVPNNVLLHIVKSGKKLNKFWSASMKSLSQMSVYLHKSSPWHLVFEDIFSNSTFFKCVCRFLIKKVRLSISGSILIRMHMSTSPLKLSIIYLLYVSESLKLPIGISFYKFPNKQKVSLTRDKYQ